MAANAIDGVLEALGLGFTRPNVIGEIHDLVRSCRPPKYVWQSDALMQHARDRKEIKILSHKGGQLPAHLMAGIERYNIRHAVRSSDLLRIERKRVKGTGQYKKWVPTAVLRLCFGRKWTPSSPLVRRRLMKKSKELRQRRRSPCATSMQELRHNRAGIRDYC